MVEAGVGHIVRRRRLGINAVTLPAEVAQPVVTLQTQCEHNRAPQQPRIHRSMRRVTRLAAIDANSRVLEQKGTALVGMAP